MKDISHLAPYDFPESAIEHHILTWLWSSKFYAFKVVSNGYFDAKIGRFRKQVSPFVKKGVSDILGQFDFGPMLACEVKTVKDHKYIVKHFDELKHYVGTDKRKNHFRDQILFIEGVNRRGGLGLFASSVDQVETAINEFLNKKEEVK